MISYLGIELKLSTRQPDLKWNFYYQNEFWKPLTYFEGYYIISSLGRVKRIAPSNNKHNTSGHLMKLFTRSNNYISLCLRFPNSKKKKILNIHRYTLLAFCPKEDSRKIVANHKNRNPLDNRLFNLEWVSQMENCHYSLRKGSSKYTGVYYSKRGMAWVSSIRFNNERIHLGTFSTEKEAAIAYKSAKEKLGIVSKYASLIEI